MTNPNPKLTKDGIINLLANNDAAIARALVVLHNRQTLDEQTSEITKHHNGMGFQPAHAFMGSNMAKFYLRRGFLTPKQIAYWRKPNGKGQMRIARYWEQLLDAAEKVRLGAPKIPGPAKKVPAARLANNPDEAAMQLMEAQGDREQTKLEERNKFLAKERIEEIAKEWRYNLK